jgi:hypothetical protein
MAKTLKGKLPSVSNNNELRRYHDQAPAPLWYAKRHGIWDHALLHVNNFAIVNAPSVRHFQLPPVHLFWGASEKKQRTYYYHFLVLWHQFRLCAQGLLGDLPGHTTDEWRSVLGDMY